MIGWLTSIFSRKSGDPYKILQEIYGSLATKSGKAVNTQTAIEVSTVFACCRVIGEGIAQVPLKLMKESKDGKTRIPDKENPLYNLLSFRPNAWQTSFEYREMLAWHVILTGNHFSFINRVRGRIYELIPLQPSRVTVKRANNYDLTYEVTADDGTKQEFPAESIWHVRGPTWNSWMGLESVKLAREAVGLAMATEDASASLHKNGVRPSGVYSVDGTLKNDDYKTLSEWVNKHLGGAENAGKALILDRAAKWQGTQMTGIDAQSLETRRFQIEEICRFFRVMPIMVGYSDKATTYASSEQMFLAHVVHTLAPWYQRLEQSIDANLLTEKDRTSGLYACFVEEGLLRGSMAETKDTILGYVNGGIMTPNEGRAKLDMNPDSDPDSDKLRIPANIVGDVAQATDANAKAIADLQSKQQPVINVDARTDIHPASVNISDGALKVSAPTNFGVKDEGIADVMGQVAVALRSVTETSQESLRINAEILKRQRHLEDATHGVMDAVLSPRKSSFVFDEKGDAIAAISTIEKDTKC